MTANATTRILSAFAAAEKRQDGQRERDVGRHRDPDPGVRWRPRIERIMNQRGKDETPDGRDHRQQGVAEIGQLAAVELALELEADQQEEDRHQRIVDPELDAEARDLRMPPA
jgi:hypothetical protein